MKLKIMSFNVQHCLNYRTQKIDYAVMVDAIQQCQAEIIGLNEMYDFSPLANSTISEIQELAARLGYYHYFARAIEIAPGKPYGNAILSKYPILSAETIAIPNPEAPLPNHKFSYEPRCVLKVTLDVGRPLCVLVSHFGLNPDEQTLAVQTVLSQIEDDRCVLMGDFNITPDNALLIPIRAELQDAAALFTEALLSFPSDNPDRKIDYIFVSKDIRLLEADIPPIVASDHRPHTAVIDI